MTPEQYQRIGDIYHEALERPADERAAYLSLACDGNEQFRRKIEALLAAHEQAGEFLAAPDPNLLDDLRAVQKPVAPESQQFGQYKVLSLIGSGGMGEVYLAEDSRLNRRVALKLLPAAFTRDPDRLRRFRQEAYAASSTNHPNIITIFDIGEAQLGEGIAHYIATEFIDGQTLRQRLRCSRITPLEALEIASQIAAALIAAHEAGIVHRDIKPENIMIRRDGYVKVLDFGLAKLSEACPSDNPQSEIRNPKLTQPGMVMGTFAYMSPEQAQAEEVDGRSDIFSLGAVLYEMVTGRVPFEGKSPVAMMAALLNNDPAPLGKHVPEELQRILAKSLAKQREHRYSTATELLNDLKNLKLEFEIAARSERVNAITPKTPDFVRPFEPLPSPQSNSSVLREMLEPVGGAVPLDSGFYVLRPTDEKFRQAIARQDSIVLVKGARQVGKTSLLARGLQQAREAGAQIVLTDFQTLTAECLGSIGQLLMTLANAFADQLDLDIFPDEVWKPNRSPAVNFEQYLRREALLKLSAPLVWGLDEIDRLFTCDFGSEVFGLFRSWHNKRALDPTGPWRRLTLAIAYATEAHLFITDLNQSPFNVGTRLQLEDFNFDQVADLNQRYGLPLASTTEIERFFGLLSGHPYLVRRGLHEMVTSKLSLDELENQACSDEGPFGDHLHRLLISLQKDAELCEVVRNILLGKPGAAPESFYRLRSSGVAVGESTREIRLRCQLYATYLEKHLL